MHSPPPSPVTIFSLDFVTGDTVIVSSPWDHCLCTAPRRGTKHFTAWLSSGKQMSSGSTAAAAGAVGDKSARACDSCLRRRARWYCAADDAFLCQACDASVHSANPLARRHERLRLRPATASPLQDSDEAVLTAALTTTTSKSKQPQPRRRQHVAPAWSRRKARTRSRRPNVKSVGELLSRKLVVVPQAASSESSEEWKATFDDDDGDQQLLYHRVPSFDRALAELCSPPAAASSSCIRDENFYGAVENASNKGPDAGVVATSSSSPVQQLPDSGLVSGFGPTDAELREFAADMEALLGQGMDDSTELDESFYMESLGLMTPPTGEEGGERVKTEPDGAIRFGHAAEMMKSETSSAEVLDIDFNCCSPAVADDDEEDDSFGQMKARGNGDNAANTQFLRRSLDLRLDYEAVIESWGTSPWTDGQRPQVQVDDFWPHHAYHSGLWPAGGGRPGGEALLTLRWEADGGREARVSRYREKRRTRLFAKKIRYEVRKLNAEKRPRMKGRFVKRPAAAAGGGAAAPCGVT